MKRLKPFLSILIVSSFLTACTEDYFEFDKITTEDWRPELAVPLINSSLTLEDIIIASDTNGIIQQNPNTKILQVVYDGRVFSSAGDFFVTLPDQNFTESINANIPSTGGPAITLPIVNREINFNSTVEVDSLLLKNGDLALTLENEFRHNIQATVQLPGFIDNNGQSLTLNYSIPARTGSAPTVRSQLVSLVGYTIDMTYGSQGHSTIPISVSVTITPTNGIGSTPNEDLSIRCQIRNLDFREFTGFLGQQTLDLAIDTIPINLFRNFTSGRIYLSNPFLDVSVFNGYGLPVDLEFETIKSRNEGARNPADREININLPNNPQTLQYANGFGVDTTDILIDRNNPVNSNIDAVISSLPREIVYDARATFNDGNANGNIRNYLTDTSRIGLDVFLRIPFEGFVQAFTLVDTLDLTFEGLDELEKGILRVSATNGFPIEANMQLVFTDDNYTPIDSIFGNGPESIVPPGLLNAPASDIRDFEVDRARLENIAKSSKILLRAVLDTRNASQTVPDTVSFTDNHRLDIALGLKGAILID